MAPFVDTAQATFEFRTYICRISCNGLLENPRIRGASALVSVSVESCFKHAMLCKLVQDKDSFCAPSVSALAERTQLRSSEPGVQSFGAKHRIQRCQSSSEPGGEFVAPFPNSATDLSADNSSMISSRTRMCVSCLRFIPFLYQNDSGCKFLHFLNCRPAPVRRQA